MPSPSRRRPAAPMLAGLVAGVVLAGALVVVPIAVSPQVAALPATLAGSATPVAPLAKPSADPLADARLGPERLPACGPIVAAMSPRQRLAQRLMVGVDAAEPAAVAETVRATQVGGIFVGGNATALLTDQALRGVQAMARVPVAVAVDDEGGRVQRIDTLDGDLPSARALASKDPAQVRALGGDRARALAARGVTMNLAPTVDLGGQPAGAVIGDRAFGTDPATVSRYAGAFAQAQREAGVFTVLKHFPGHGRASGDSHRGRVRTPPVADLRASDLQPYADLLAGPLGDGRTGVMVGHLDVPGLTDGLPSSLTPAVYALLRGDYGFDGLVLTDDLGAMKAVTGTFELPEAVQRALGAGADMALWSSGGSVSPVLDRLEQALAKGQLDPAANDRSVERVLTAKGACVLHV